jgi:hypothetical protein
MGSDKNIGNPTAVNCNEHSETTLDKDQYRRMRNAYNWYKLLAEPTRATMRRILDYTKGADFTNQDVDLLPWNLDETEVTEGAMKSLKKEKKENKQTKKKETFLKEELSEVTEEAMKSPKKEKKEKKEKKQTKKEKKEKKQTKKKETFLKEELDHSLTSLETSLNSSSGYSDASLTSLETSLNSSSGNMDPDGIRYENDKGELEDEYRINCDILQTVTVEEECISKMVERHCKKEECRQKRDDQQKREEVKKKSMKRDTDVEIKEDSEDAHRQRAFQWYMRMATPCRKELKRQVAALAWADITEDDIDLLPWNLAGSRVSIAKMNAFTRASIMNY